MAYYLSVTNVTRQDAYGCVISWQLLNDATTPPTVVQTGSSATLGYAPITATDVMGQPLADVARREISIYGPLVGLAKDMIARAQAADIDHPIVASSLIGFRYPPAS